MQIKITHNIPQIKELFIKYPEVSKQVRDRKVTEAIFLLKRAIEEETPEGAGPVHMKTRYWGKTVEYVNKTIGVLGQPANYFEPVEYGSKAHVMPKTKDEIGWICKPLLFWVEKKLHLSGKKARSVTWAITKIIEDSGTHGQHMVQYGFENSEYKLFQILESIPNEIIKEISGMTKR